MPNHKCPSLNQYCVLCARYVKSISRKTLNDTIKTNFKNAYKVDMPNDFFIPKIMCTSCVSNLSAFKNGKRSLVPEHQHEWKKPKTDHSDCEICCNKQNKYYHRQERNNYSKINIETINDNDEFENFLNNENINNENIDGQSSPISKHEQDSSFNYDIEFTSSYTSRKSTAPEKINKPIFDFLTKEMSKLESEIFASRFNDLCILDKTVKVEDSRTRSDYIQDYFINYNETTVYCPNIEKLFNEVFQQHYNPNCWRLFMDSGNNSFKAVLLHNGNFF